MCEHEYTKVNSTGGRDTKRLSLPTLGSTQRGSVARDVDHEEASATVVASRNVDVTGGMLKSLGVGASAAAREDKIDEIRARLESLERSQTMEDLCSQTYRMMLERAQKQELVFGLHQAKMRAAIGEETSAMRRAASARNDAVHARETARSRRDGVARWLDARRREWSRSLGECRATVKRINDEQERKYRKEKEAAKEAQRRKDAMQAKVESHLERSGADSFRQVAEAAQRQLEQVVQGSRDTDVGAARSLSPEGFADSSLSMNAPRDREDRVSLAKKLLQRLGKNEIEQSIGKMALRFETVFANNRALQRDVADKTIRADCLEEEEKALRKEHRDLTSQGLQVLEKRAIDEMVENIKQADVGKAKAYTRLGGTESILCSLHTGFEMLANKLAAASTNEVQGAELPMQGGGALRRTSLEPGSPALTADNMGERIEALLALCESRLDVVMAAVGVHGGVVHSADEGRSGPQSPRAGAADHEGHEHAGSDSSQWYDACEGSADGGEATVGGEGADGGGGGGTQAPSAGDSNKLSADEMLRAVSSNPFNLRVRAGTAESTADGGRHSYSDRGTTPLARLKSHKTPGSLFHQGEDDDGAEELDRRQIKRRQAEQAATLRKAASTRAGKKADGTAKKAGRRAGKKSGGKPLTHP